MRRRLMLAGVGAVGLAIPLLPVARASAALPDPNLKLIFRYLAGWNFHDVERASSCFADDVVYFDASVGMPVDGKAAATKDVVANFIHAAPDLAWGLRGAPIVQGSRVAFEWQFSGTNSGAWADGTAATDKHFAFNGVTMIETRDEQIVRQSDYYDALGFYKQLGWI